MKRVYSFALGNIWRWSSSANRNGLIRFIRRLDIAGVELTFSSEKDLYRFKPTQDHISWLKTLPYVTIHAPFNLFESKSHKDILQQLEIISRLYNIIDAKSVIVHPAVSESLMLLTKFPINISIENMPPKNRFDVTALKRIFNRFPHFDFCLDVSHAYLCSKFETDDLLQAFGDRLSQIHLSGTYRRKSHQSLTTVTQTFLTSIEQISDLKIPFVIEEDFRQRSFRAVSEEIAFIKAMFGDPSR